MKISLIPQFGQKRYGDRDLTTDLISRPENKTKIQVTEPMILGRNKKADILISDDQISRYHILLWPTQNGLCVKNISGSLGMKVNGGEKDKAILNNADVLDAGPYFFVVNILSDKEEEIAALETMCVVG